MRQEIGNGLWSAIKNAFNSNFIELYENKQTPVSDSGTFTFLFGDNTEASQTGNIKFEITDESKINVSRYDSSQEAGEEWVLVAVIGSIETDYVNLTGTNPRVFTEVLDTVNNFMRSTQTVPNGIDVGDLSAKLFFSSSEKPVIVTQTSQTNEVENSGDLETFNGTSLCTFTTHANYGKDTALKIKCVDPIGKIRINVFDDIEKTNLQYQSHTDWQFYENGEGYDLVSGINTINLGVNPITFGANTMTCIEFESITDLSICGETIEGIFKPYLERTVVNGVGSDVATEDYVDEKYTSLPWGAGYFESQISTYCKDSNTWYKVEATFTPTKEQNFTFDTVNKRWTFTNTSHPVSIFASWTGGHDDDSTRKISWEFRKNGVSLEYAPKTVYIERYDTMSMSLLIPYIELQTGDYIELYARVDDSPYDYVKTSNFNLMIR